METNLTLVLETNSNGNAIIPGANQGVEGMKIALIAAACFIAGAICMWLWRYKTGGLFSNGNKRAGRLMLFELICGAIIMAGSQILAALPSQSDWLTPIMIKKGAFVIGALITIVKAVEFFFNKTAALIKDHTISFDTQEFTKPKSDT